MKLFLTSLLFWSTFTLACTCGELEIPKPDNKADLEENHWYTARVLSIEPFGTYYSFTLKVMVVIETDFSGNIDSDTLAIYTSSGSCGFRMDIGASYLLSSRKRKELYVSTCTYHRRKEDAIEDIDKLKKHFNIN